MPPSTTKKPRRKRSKKYLALIPGEKAERQILAMPPEDRMALASLGLPKHLQPTGKKFGPI